MNSALLADLASRISLFQYRGSQGIYSLMKAMTRLLPDPVAVPTPYGKFLMRRSTRVFSCALDLMEPQVQPFFHKNIRDAKCFIDVGAAYGWYSLKAARLMDKPQILALEPNPDSFPFLLRNVEADRLGSIVPLNLAAYSSDGKILLDGRQTECRSLDSLLSERKIEAEGLFIKIDVEGMAGEVLDGMTYILHSRPTLLVELHAGEEKVPSLVGYEEYGYRIEMLPGLMLLAHQ